MHFFATFNLNPIERNCFASQNAITVVFVFTCSSWLESSYGEVFTVHESTRRAALCYRTGPMASIGFRMTKSASKFYM